MTCQIKSCKKKNATCSGVNYSRMPLIPSCGTNQKVTAPEKRMSACLCAKINGKDCWLTALTTCHGKLVVQNKLYQGYQHGLNNQKITSNRQY